jgi:hypothetical protein
MAVFQRHEEGVIFQPGGEPCFDLAHAAARLEASICAAQECILVGDDRSEIDPLGRELRQIIEIARREQAVA